MDEQKLFFLTHDLFSFRKDFSNGLAAGWGKMNSQQMVEHLADFFDVSTEKIKFDLVTPGEHLPKFKEFLLSDKQFRENTKAPTSVLGEDPLPERRGNMQEAMQHLENSVNDFVAYFQNDPLKKTTHPVFGPLNFDEWVLLHYKHVTHHLRQFGLMAKNSLVL